MKAIVTISTEAKPALTLIFGYIEINLKRGWPLHVDLSQQSELLNWKSNNTDPKPFQRHNSASNFIGTCFEPFFFVDFDLYFLFYAQVDFNDQSSIDFKDDTLKEM